MLWTQPQFPRGHSILKPKAPAGEGMTPEKSLGRAQAYCPSPWLSRLPQDGQQRPSRNGCLQHCGPALADLGPLPWTEAQVSTGDSRVPLHAAPLQGSSRPGSDGEWTEAGGRAHLPDCGRRTVVPLSPARNGPTLEQGRRGSVALSSPDPLSSVPAPLSQSLSCQRTPDTGSLCPNTQRAPAHGQPQGQDWEHPRWGTLQRNPPGTPFPSPQQHPPGLRPTHGSSARPHLPCARSLRVPRAPPGSSTGTPHCPGSPPRPATRALSRDRRQPPPGR